MERNGKRGAPPIRERIGTALRGFKKRHREGARKTIACAMTAVLALNGVLGTFTPSVAYADDDFVTRWDSSAMHERNHIVLNGDATLRDTDITLEGFDAEIVEDVTQNVDESGWNDEFSISVAGLGENPDIGIWANYRNVGVDPTNGERISAVMHMTNFTISPEEYTDDINSSWGTPFQYEDFYDGEVPLYLNPDAHQYDTPCIRLASNFDGGYWMQGVEKVTIDYYFYYGDDPDDRSARVDLSQAFLTIMSLDHDSNGVAYDGELYGQEAVNISSDKYDLVLLTPNSRVGRWGDITGYSGHVYPGSMDDDPSVFYNADRTTGTGYARSDLAVTAFGVSDGSDQFAIDMIDTEGWTHNMPFFGTIGTVQPPEPVKSVLDKDTNEWVEADEGYVLDDTVTFKVEQYVPGRDEQLGSYTSMNFHDDIQDDLEVTDFKVYRDGMTDEVTSGTKTGPGENAVNYDFDLGAEDVYGHTYTFVITCKVVDYPEGSTLIIPNDGTTTFGASNGDFTQTTNEVTVELVNPELAVEKHLIIDDDASVINDYEYLIGDTVTYEAKVWNENPGTRAKDVTFYDQMPAGLDYIEGSATVIDDGGSGAQVVDDGNGWKATFTNFDYNDPVVIRYQALATEDGNGTEVINTAKAWAVNVPKDTDGNETQEAWNDSEAYINDPHLDVKKSVTQSEIQNPDYQRGEEYRVDDTFTYSVTVTNTEPGTFAENVVITDDQMPEGFEIVGEISVSGLDENGHPKTIEMPMHFDDDKHGQTETREIVWSKKDIKRENGSWGWEVDVNYLAYNMPVTITWTVKATEAMNGYEVYNRAWAKAENQPNDTFWSVDDSSDETRGQDYTIVWINSPDFQIDKSVRKTDSAYQVGDVASYDVLLTGLKTPGTLARQTTLEDEFLQEGTTIIEDSFVITDKPTEDEPQDISGQVELNRYVGKQGWHIDMTQVYSDDCGYWVSSEDWRPIYKDGNDGRVDGEHNPVLSKPEYDKEACSSDEVTYGHDYFKVHYEATINDMALQNEIIHNEATADSLEGYPVTDDAEVTAIGAQLMINKDSTDGGHFAVGDVSEYEITITNNATGTVAEDVQIKDGFTTAKAGTVSIVEGSIELFDNQNQPIELSPEQITYTRNEAGGIFGFEIDTNYDLPSSQKITVRYDVKYLANNGGDVVTNVAYTWASNAPEVNDPYETWPEDMDQSDLRLDKGSDKQVYKGGEFGTYTLNIVNHSDEPALNVTINDDITLDSVGVAQIVQGTIKIWDHHGDAVSWDRIEYHYANGGQIRGFTIYTDHDIEPNESMQVVYQVRFDEVSQDTTVHNDAWAAADNTGKATDDNDVLVTPDGNPPETPPDIPGEGDDNNPGDPELSIQKTTNKQWFTPGETGRYELRVTNTVADTTAENVTIEDGLDADARDYASIVEGSIVVTDAMGAPISVQSVSYDKDDEGRVYGFTIDTGYDLANGGAIDVAYDVVFDGTVKDTVDVHNIAAADSDNTPPAETDHTVNLDPEGRPELKLDKSADKSVVAPGDTLTYKVVVTQPAEGQVATDTVITDELPEGFTLDQSSVKVERDGHAMTCDTEFPDGKLRVSLGDVAYGETWTITYSGTVDEDFLGDELHNVVTGESPDIPEDPTDETTTPVTNPKLTIEKTSDETTVEPGDDLVWQITVTQVNKDAVANGTVVTDELPEGFSAEQADVTVTDAQGNDRSANVTLSDGKLTVDLGDLGYNDPVTISVPGTVDEDFEGDSILNTAVADADNIPDPVDDDADVNVEEQPAIDIEKASDKDTVYAGGKVSYTVTATIGDKDLENVVVTDDVPEELTIDQESVKVYLNDEPFEPETDDALTVEGNLITANMGDLKADDVVRIEYDCTVADDVPDGTSITNVATAEANGVDPVDADKTVNVPSDEPGLPDTNNPSSTDDDDPIKDLGKNLGKTGDAIVEHLPMLLTAMVAVCLLCVAMYRRDDMLLSAESIGGPIGAAASSIIAKMGGNEAADNVMAAASEDAPAAADASDEPSENAADVETVEDDAVAQPDADESAIEQDHGEPTQEPELDDSEGDLNDTDEGEEPGSDSPDDAPEDDEGKEA